MSTKKQKGKGRKALEKFICSVVGSTWNSTFHDKRKELTLQSIRRSFRALKLNPKQAYIDSPDLRVKLKDWVAVTKNMIYEDGKSVSYGVAWKANPDLILLPSEPVYDPRIILHLKAWLNSNYEIWLKSNPKFAELEPEKVIEKLTRDMLSDLDPQTGHPHCLGKWIVIKARERIIRLLPPLIGDMRMQLGLDGVNERLDDHDDQLDGINNRLDDLQTQVENIILNKENKPATSSPTLVRAVRKASTNPLELNQAEMEALKGLVRTKYHAAVLAYTESQLLFNALHRQNDGDLSMVQQSADVIKALDVLPCYVGTVERAAAFTTEQVRRLYKVGMPVKDDGFFSTTILSFEEHGEIELDVFQDFNCRYKIQSKTGKYIGFLAAATVANEHEVLFRPGTWFKVVSVMKDEARTRAIGKDCWQIELEEVDTDADDESEASDA